MASASHRDLMVANAMTVQLDRRSSDQRNSSDDDAEEEDVSPSLRKKEMLEREYNDDDDAFFDNGSDDPPYLASSSGDGEDDDQELQDLIRESAELFKPDGNKQSRVSLAKFAKGQLLARLMKLAKEEQAHKFSFCVCIILRLHQILTGRALLPTQRDRQPVSAPAFHGFW
jgi:hypothetical protein